jgi:hypothetical protein
VRLAARGQRDLDTGPEAIADPDERAQAKRQARAVYLKSFLAAAVLTALAFIL